MILSFIPFQTLYSLFFNVNYFFCILVHIFIEMRLIIGSCYLHHDVDASSLVTHPAERSIQLAEKKNVENHIYYSEIKQCDDGKLTLFPADRSWLWLWLPKRSGDLGLYLGRFPLLKLPYRSSSHIKSKLKWKKQAIRNVYRRTILMKCVGRAYHRDKSCSIHETYFHSHHRPSEVCAMKIVCHPAFLSSIYANLFSKNMGIRLV